MSGNAEEGIAKTQLDAAKNQGSSIGSVQTANSRYLNERIIVFLLALLLIALLLVWMTTSSPLLLYGSLVTVIGLVIVAGVLRIKSIEDTRRERDELARSWQENKSD